ncbi:hypothetical protein G6O67_003128 [Ophiocordyceps sinensis]|uniref:Calpain n=1 Tax=Ophiocordyceps sinensis TaxID=72228 RepID=A0A8H4PVT9_9HYPO|nr:hypothetical protein G6O67_003128 [Ophiocordyceps sinensis]
MSASLPSSLEGARVQRLPLAAYYIPDFITREEEELILGKIASAPRPKWKQLTHRRLQTWPSDLVQDKLLHAPLPPWLEDPVVSRLLSLPVSKGNSQHIFAQSPHARPNHVLVNEYPPGVGIMPHKTAPRIGQSCALLYTNHFHGIADIDEDEDLSAEGGVVNWPLLGNPEEYASGGNVRGTRTSLTYRDVLGVSMVGKKLGLFGKR